MQIYPRSPAGSLLLSQRGPKPRCKIISPFNVNAPSNLRCAKGAKGWFLIVFNGMHNHPTAVYLKEYPYLGRLLDKETELLVEMSTTYTVKPREILESGRGRLRGPRTSSWG